MRAELTALCKPRDYCVQEAREADRIPQGQDVLPLDQAASTDQLPASSVSRHLLQRSRSRGPLPSDAVHVMQTIGEERQESVEGSGSGHGSGSSSQQSAARAAATGAPPRADAQAGCGSTGADASVEIEATPPAHAVNGAAAHSGGDAAGGAAPEIVVVHVPGAPELPMPASMKALNAPQSIFGERRGLQDSRTSTYEARAPSGTPRAAAEGAAAAATGGPPQPPRCATSPPESAPPTEPPPAAAAAAGGGSSGHAQRRSVDASTRKGVALMQEESWGMTESPASRTEAIGGGTHTHDGGAPPNECSAASEEGQESAPPQKFAYVPGSGWTVASRPSGATLPDTQDSVSGAAATAGRREMHIFKPQNPYTR